MASACDDPRAAALLYARVRGAVDLRRVTSRKCQRVTRPKCHTRPKCRKCCKKKKGQKQIDQLESGGGGASMYETPGAGAAAAEEPGPAPASEYADWN